MNEFAMRMLVGDRGKFFGLILALTFVSLLITHTSSVFLGVMSRTVSTIRDTRVADIWVMDPKTQYLEDVQPMKNDALYRVRGVRGVSWAVPYHKSSIRAKLADGSFQSCVLIGLDDPSLAGGPATMVEGSLGDLRRDGGVIVDIDGARSKLARGGRPPHTGDTFELGDKRVQIVGLARVHRPFQSQPVIYTTYSRAMAFRPGEPRGLSFVLVKVREGENPEAVAARIREATGLGALTSSAFMWLTIRYYLLNTGVVLNFGMVIGICFFVGTTIAGQTFHNFTSDNLRHFGALKAMGASHRVLLMMIVLQALLVAATGYGLGVGGAALFGYLTRATEIAFLMPWHLLVLSGAAVVAIAALSAAISIRRVLRLEPAMVFRG